MQVRHCALWILPAVLIACGTNTASGQNYPNRPIRIVTPGTGGGGDVAARLIVPGLSSGLGQQVVVDNRPSGVIPGTIVSRAQPDGYTLLITSSSHWLAQYMQDDTPYDAVKDFSPVTIVVNAPTILVVNPALAAKSVRELIALAKSKQGELNYASIASGSPTHLAAELFKSMAGVNIVRIPYKGTGSALIDLVGGQVQIMFANAVSVGAHVKSGRLRALAVTGAQPSAVFPGLPTVAATGLPGYEMASTQGIFAPAGTPAAIIRRLNEEIVRALNSTEVKNSLLRSGVDVVANSPEQFLARIKSEMTRLDKVIRDAGIREE